MTTRKNSSIKIESISVEQSLRTLVGAQKLHYQSTRVGKPMICGLVKEVFFAEHKDCTAKKVGLNQVHCTRYEVIIVDLSGNEYYDYDYAVLDPAFIFTKVLNKKGQHSHSAIECAQVNLNMDEIDAYGCSSDELRARIDAAYEIGEKNQTLKMFAQKKAQEILDRASADMKELKEILNDSQR
jgi:hypothetical protein